MATRLQYITPTSKRKDIHNSPGHPPGNPSENSNPISFSGASPRATDEATPVGSNLENISPSHVKGNVTRDNENETSIPSKQPVGNNSPYTVSSYSAKSVADNNNVEILPSVRQRGQTENESFTSASQHNLSANKNHLNFQRKYINKYPGASSAPPQISTSHRTAQRHRSEYPHVQKRRSKQHGHGTLVDARKSANKFLDRSASASASDASIEPGLLSALHTAFADVIHIIKNESSHAGIYIKTLDSSLTAILVAKTMTMKRHKSRAHTAATVDPSLRNGLKDADSAFRRLESAVQKELTTKPKKGRGFINATQKLTKKIEAIASRLAVPFLEKHTVDECLRILEDCAFLIKNVPPVSTQNDGSFQRALHKLFTCNHLVAAALVHSFVHPGMLKEPPDADDYRPLYCRRGRDKPIIEAFDNALNIARNLNGSGGHLIFSSLHEFLMLSKSYGALALQKHCEDMFSRDRCMRCSKT